MRGKPFIWLVLTVLTVMSGAAHCGEEDAPATTDNAWRKGWGRFGVMLLLTDKPNELLAAWGQSGAGVPASAPEMVKRDTPVVGLVIFTGCSVNQKGLCDADVFFQVFKPDGTPYNEERKGELWVGKPPPRAGELQLGAGGIGVRIEEKDPDGVYTVRARVRDNISQAEATLERTFQVDGNGPGNGVAPGG